MKDARIVVTGATGNVGRAVIELLASRGTAIVAVDRNEAKLRQMLAALPEHARHQAIVAGDLSAPESWAGVMAEARGAITGLVHTVGGFATGGIASGDVALWEQMFRMNALTGVHGLRAVVPALRASGGGSVVLIGAGAGLHSPAGLGAYAASKSALFRLVEAAAAEFGRELIRVNAVLPDVIDTPQNRAAMPNVDPTPLLKPAEVAEAIAFLLSPAASGVNGALLPLNGRK